MCDQALVGNGARDLFIERSDTADGEGVVNAVHRLLHCVRDRVEVAVVANGKVAVTPGVLRVRDVVDVLRFLLQASELDVLHNANHLNVSVGLWIVSGVVVMPDWSTAWGKQVLHHALADDCDVP